LDFDMDIRSAVDAPRLHHQWFPDQVRFEGISEHATAVRDLRGMGHDVVGSKQGDAHSIWVDPRTGRILAAEDRRISGQASVY
jgi:gamma-glutamyltranspeptidase/glutathione hydrolase